MKKIVFFVLGLSILFGAFRYSHVRADPSAPLEQNEQSDDRPDTPLEDDEIQLEDGRDSGDASVGESEANLPKIEEYEVQSGDTLYSIAIDHGIHVATITYENDITENSVLSIGQVLKILPFDGLRYTVKSGDTLSKIAKQFDAKEEKIIEVNQLVEPVTLKIDQVLFVPDATIPVVEKNNTAKKVNASPTQTKSTTSTSSGQITWTSGALAELNKVYATSIKAAVKKKIEDYATSHGITVITKEVYLSIHI